ncbi:uncharacterized protein [Ptychodera flava]|uniref:uncharacterized protein n=1 Tax=Ptychodera flava TaxID=63121 RepID=UPI003969FEB3
MAVFDNRTMFVLFWLFLRFLRLRRDNLTHRSLLNEISGIQELTGEPRRRNRRSGRQQREEIRRSRRRFVFLTTIAANAPLVNTVDRRIWTRFRSRNWWEDVVLRTWNDSDWVENFRMTKATFRFLCNRLRDRINRIHTRFRSAVMVDQRIAITLWKLGTNCDYRTIGHLFGVGRSTVCEIFRETCKAICDELLAEVIHLPTQHEAQRIVAGFRNKWGFPQALGAIDGSHIPILAPEINPTDYYNRKGFYSIVLQAIADDNYCFMNVNVGWAGSVHDARVFANSSVYQKLQENTLFPNITENISGVEIPLVLLGDPAYPLLQNLMKPFSDNGRLTPHQHRFNRRLSSARMVIENAFGRLKGRWRCLLKRSDCNLDILPNVVLACCVLHNLCEQHRNPFNDGWLEGVEDFEGPNEQANIPDDRSAINIRRAIMEHFSNE